MVLTRVVYTDAEVAAPGLYEHTRWHSMQLLRHVSSKTYESFLKLCAVAMPRDGDQEDQVYLSPNNAQEPVVGGGLA